MKGYQVVTSDEKTVGRVVEVQADHLIVEHGTLRKSRHALPKAFAHPVDADEVVRVTVSKELIDDSPKLHEGEFDARAVARHYGLAGGYDAPDTAGRGEVVADDPAESAEMEGRRHGIEPADKRRAEMRKGGHEPGPRAAKERMPNAIDGGTTANH